jgi:uncharacterized protein
MSDSWLMAFALMMVVEGLLPFAVPSVWRDTFKKLTELSDGQIRFIGLISIVSGMAFIFVLKQQTTS